MTKMILQGQQLTEAIVSTVTAAVAGDSLPQAYGTIIETDRTLSSLELTALRQAHPVDINCIPAHFDANKAALFVSDMDSTLISIECIDEIADFIGTKSQVSAITEAAMRGDIDFDTSLRQRVALLKGLDVSVLDQVYQQRLSLNPGAKDMLAGLKQRGIKTALVSGGFTFFTDKLKQELGLDYAQANVLAEQDGRLTGEVAGAICGAQAKADFIVARCQELGITTDQVITIGDGANDLLMMAQSSLSIAYHAKPKVQQQAMTALNHCGLEGVLGLLQ